MELGEINFDQLDTEDIVRLVEEEDRKPLHVPESIRDYIKEEAKKNGQKLNVYVPELLLNAVAFKKQAKKRIPVPA